MDPVDFHWFPLYPCAMSFFQRLFSAPFPPVSWSLPEPHPDPQGCLYNLLERQPENSWPWEGNPLILPSTGHTGDVGDAHLQSGGPRRSSRLDLPRIWSLKCCHTSTCSGIRQSQGSQEVVTPQPAQGPNSREAVMPRPAQEFDL